MPGSLATRLADNFEAAYQEFATNYFWKVRLHNAGVRLYSDLEFYEDLYGIAREHDLFAVALWSYFRTLHPPEA
jgi:hypothetical protein